MATIEIPALLRPFTNQQPKLTIDGQLIKEIILKLTADYPDLKKYLIDEQENLNPFINIYLNGKDIRHLNKELTAIRNSDIIMIIPAIAGG